MAYEVLEAIYAERTIVQDCQHDIESFIWVLSYSIGRRWVTKSGRMDHTRHQKFREFFHHNFGCVTLATILATRSGLSGPLDIAESYPEIVSPPLIPLFSHLRGLVYSAHSPPDAPNVAVTLTYDSVLNLLTKTIEELRGS